MPIYRYIIGANYTLNSQNYCEKELCKLSQANSFYTVNPIVM